MVGVPPSLDTDSEDVSWALQTAEALWKRNERGDALVWLRRAAQAAAEMDDNDRALSLARDAAELTEWAAARRSSRPPPSETEEVLLEDLLPRPEEDSIDEVTMSEISAELPSERERGGLVDALRRLASVKDAMGRGHGSGPPAEDSTLRMAVPVSPPRPPPPPHARAWGAFAVGAPAPASAVLPPISRVPPRSVGAFPAGRSQPQPPPLPVVTPAAGDVRTAAEAHAGMLDPWADSERQPRKASPSMIPRPPAASAFEAEEIVTSAPPVVRSVEAATALRAAPASGAIAISSPEGRRGALVDLSDVLALTDLPDDARDEFAREATMRDLARGGEVVAFALALLVRGSVDITAAGVDTPAMRLHPGDVVRGRGTIEHATPLRLVATVEGARVATWTEEEVVSAFRSFPWVEDDLRQAGNLVQALVGATLGRLGHRFDRDLREQVTSRLTLRTLVEHELFAKAGEPIPGLLMVGAGDLELVKDGTPQREPLQAGEFLFPSEVLRAQIAPSDVRAGAGGTLVLIAPRALAQELLLTYPPLLEIFAEGA